MMAEVVVDVLCAATGMVENFGAEAPKDARAIEVGASRVNSSISYAFRIFGRPLAPLLAIAKDPWNQLCPRNYI